MMIEREPSKFLTDDYKYPKLSDLSREAPTVLDPLNETKPFERVLDSNAIEDLSRFWSEKARNWEKEPPSTQDLFKLLSDVIAIRNNLGLTSGQNKETDISTDDTHLIISVDSFFPALRLEAGSTKGPTVRESLLFVKYPASGEFPSYVAIDRYVDLGGLSYISPSSNSPVEYKPQAVKGFSRTETTVLAEKIWNGHLKNMELRTSASKLD